MTTIKDKLFTLKLYVKIKDNLDIDIPAENLDGYRRCVEDIDHGYFILKSVKICIVAKSAFSLCYRHIGKTSLSI